MGKRICVAVLVLTLLTGSLFGQDGHYWTQQYGTKSMLLSGSVIGGVSDLGAVYYNPGRLAVIENPAFLLSASVYEYSSIDASDVFGNSKGASKSEFKGVPTLAAGTFKVKKLPKHHFAYAIMTRQQSDVSTSYKNEVFQDVFPSLGPGSEYFSGEVSIQNVANEQWFGITWSHALSPKVSVGVTTNYVTNSQTKGAGIDLRALDTTTNQVAIYHYKRNYDYKESGLLWKVGLATTLGKWDLGLTVKTPLVSLSGTGNYNYEEFYSWIPGLSAQQEVYKTSGQAGLPLKTKSSWAIGLGITRPLGKNKLHISTEYYSAVPKYTVMQATTHYSQTTPTDTLDFVLTDQAKGVWNAGIGFEIFLSTHVSGFASFSTDFATVSDDITRFIQRKDEASNSSWKADFYHWGGGVVLDFKGADITLGVTHTGAQQTVPRLLNFPDGGGGGGSIFDPTTTADLKWDRWRFVFSFSFPFLADYAKKLEGGGDK